MDSEKAKAVLERRFSFKMVWLLYRNDSDMLLLVSLASPKEITSAAIVNAVRSGEARAYADTIEQNIETIKNSDEALILIQEPPKTPELFTTDEIETWRFGTAEYYGKIKFVIMKSWISDRRWGIKAQIKLKRQKKRRLLR